jgi:hypothetical protein
MSKFKVENPRKGGKTNSERELNCSGFLQYIEIIGFFVTIDLCDPHGMMECWNIGIVRIKSGKNRFAFFFRSTHHSNILGAVRRTLE